MQQTCIMNLDLGGKDALKSLPDAPCENRQRAAYGEDSIAHRGSLEVVGKMIAVLGSIHNELSTLKNDIIKSGQAGLVTWANNILVDYQLSRQTKKQAYQLTIEDQMAVDLLEGGIKELDFLSKNCAISTNLLNSCLTTLAIRGIIRRMLGRYISLA